MMTGQTIQDLARERTGLHRGQSSCRPLSRDYDLVGLAGEKAFEDASGLSMDRSARPAGDGGSDFNVHVGMRLDVKTARRPICLLVEKGHVDADIYVLARYDEATQSAELLGWTWAGKVLAAPVRDFGRGIINHYIPREKLRPMSALLQRLQP